MSAAAEIVEFAVGVAGERDLFVFGNAVDDFLLVAVVGDKFSRFVSGYFSFDEGVLARIEDCISFSMAARSSGVKGRSTSKS